MSNGCKETDVGTVAIAALVGGIAGAAVGLMLAPKSGRELRRDIGFRARQTLNGIEGVAEEKADKIQDVGEDLLFEGRRLADDLKSLFSEFRRALSKNEIEVVSKSEDTPE
ncbi:MAG: YtxH domain-containing protein [Desulfitobacteriaceae bacterium]|nr:YtxH domain-containing protein [Desulfitobacteriaceae bacterium]MDD4345886.1 YtxH domain-containing protein [Desulfitobacteriaceae bacterium]MDD4401783.1 YtxH domain-containing protein [Desulfitobacteriaceae bacterium]